MVTAAKVDDVDFLVIGCGPAGGIAAREAARAGVETLVLERDSVVGAKRVCAAGLRPGFTKIFDLPRSVIHCDTPIIALHDGEGERYEFPCGVSHTTTREELDGNIARLAREAGAEIRTSALYRGAQRDGDATIVEYADLRSGERRRARARNVFLAQGSSARIEPSSPLTHPQWASGLITCYQYRVYLERPAVPQAYLTLEMHYYVDPQGRNVIGWMFPKRDHLSIGVGIQSKIAGAELRAELDRLLARMQARLFPGIGYTLREEGNLLYGGTPRPCLSDEDVLIGGTAAGLVDATTGEGIYEAAMSGRFAAEAIALARRGAARQAAQLYERLTKNAFYSRLHHRHRLMTHLERNPKRFELLFAQLRRAPLLAALLQRERDDFTVAEWLYLYAQAAQYGLRAAFA